MYHEKSLRKYRHSNLNYFYSITTCTNYRHKYFNDFYLARNVIQAMMFQDQNKRTESLAFVVMPDHLHWLFQLKQKSLDTVIHSVKSFTANQFGSCLWQPGYHDHTVRSEEELIKLSRYIVANPLRAGLVENIHDYPHWDAVLLGGKF
jgi:putative transposase